MRVSANGETPLTNDELAEILARAHAATPGPWVCRDQFIEAAQVPSQLIGVTMQRQEEGLEALPGAQNAQFIAHARLDIPRLVAEILHLREQLHELNGMDASYAIAGGSLLDAQSPHA